MSIEERFGNFFKPEMKSSGRKLVAQEKVSISSGSDTAIQAYIRVAPPFKVTLSAESIESKTITAECSCPVAKKSRFCKHVWATLIAGEEKYPDFFMGKQELNPPSTGAESSNAAKNSYAEDAKQRASEYRKEQYQKQKQHAKAKKNENKNAATRCSAHSLSSEEEAAVAYFSLNGFPMPEGPTAETLTEAKRTLSRVFHPDKGGTHEETVELNHHYELLARVVRG